MQLSQVRWDECNWSTWYPLCQNIILHQTVSTNDHVRQRQTPDYANQINRQAIHVPIVTSKDTYQNVKISQGDELVISVPDNYIETGLQQDFSDCELVQDEYLKSLEMTDKSERFYHQTCQ